MRTFWVLPLKFTTMMNMAQVGSTNLLLDAELVSAHFADGVMKAQNCPGQLEQ
jgi:hypothetical protein